MGLCLNCGQLFADLSVTQKYCCAKCGDQYRRHHKIVYEQIEFNCAFCGKKVVTEPDKRDKRSRFCCEHCEKMYWKHTEKEKAVKSSISNFHSLAEYASYEKRTNGNA